MGKAWLTVQEAANELDVTRTRIWTLINRKGSGWRWKQAAMINEFNRWIISRAAIESYKMTRDAKPNRRKMKTA